MAFTARSVASPRVINIHDLRRLAKRRLPRVVFDYLDGGAEDEFTLRENCRVFEGVTFRPRYAVAMPQCDLHTRVLGADLAFPVILAPVGYSRLMHPAGELAAASAAGSAGLIYTLSTISAHKLENVRAASTGPVWYQLYIVGGRDVAEAGIERAQRAGFSALVVTIDTPVAGLRERDPRNGMKELLGGSIFSKLPFLPQMFARPGWLGSCSAIPSTSIASGCASKASRSLSFASDARVWSRSSSSFSEGNAIRIESPFIWNECTQRKGGEVRTLAAAQQGPQLRKRVNE